MVQPTTGNRTSNDTIADDSYSKLDPTQQAIHPLQRTRLRPRSRGNRLVLLFGQSDFGQRGLRGGISSSSLSGGICRHGEAFLKWRPPSAMARTRACHVPSLAESEP